MISFVKYDKPCTRAQLSRRTKEAQKNIFLLFYFFISISFAVKLQATVLWFASGPPRDKMCVFVNLLLFPFSRFYTFSIKAFLVNCLFHLSSLFVYHLNCLESQLEFALLKIQSIMYLTLSFYNSKSILLEILFIDFENQNPR